MPILIRSLQKNDRRELFLSGQPDLDQFFHRYAGQNQFRYHIGVTYIATDETTIFGYATLAAGSLETESLPANARLPANYPLPILRLGRLAVDSRHQDRGIGKLLMRHVFELALQQQKQVGCIGVVVDAKPHAVPYYSRYGFTLMGSRAEMIEGTLDLHPVPLPMFLSIKSIQPSDSPT